MVQVCNEFTDFSTSFYHQLLKTNGQSLQLIVMYLFFSLCQSGFPSQVSQERYYVYARVGWLRLLVIDLVLLCNAPPLSLLWQSRVHFTFISDPLAFIWLRFTWSIFICLILPSSHLKCVVCREYKVFS